MDLLLTATNILHCTHASTIGLYFLGAHTFSLCTLQKSAPLSTKRRYLTTCLMFALVMTYATQGIHRLHTSTRCATQQSNIDILSSILVWGSFTAVFSMAHSILWQPYLGIFVIQVLFETALCALNSVYWSSMVGFNFSTLRAILSLALAIYGFMSFLKNRPRKPNEDGECLFGRNSHYGSILPDRRPGAEPGRNTNIEEQQHKRLRQEGGWIGYMRGFAIFLPYLWPKGDWRVMTSLGIRLTYVVSERVLSPLIPHYLGLITNKLASEPLDIPWKDFGLWRLYAWIGSAAGFGVVDRFAADVIRNFSRRQICDMAFKHVMSLSMDFHSNKDSGEVLKAMDHASSINDLIELVLFEVCPIVADLVVATWYITYLFDVYMAFIVLYTGIGYIWLGITFTNWTRHKRRSHVERSIHENKTLYESVSNWLMVTWHNRAPYERERYGATVRDTISAHFESFFRIRVANSLQDLLMQMGLAGCCILAIQKIVSGEKPVGSLLTLVMYWGSMMRPVRMITSSYNSIASALLDAEGLLQLVMRKPSVVDNEGSSELSITSPCKVEFKNVGFAFDEHTPILNGVSFIAKPGQNVAIVGRSGEGKSTILRLLFRHYDVTQGSIEINGKDIRSYKLSSLRNALSVVPQDPAMFNRSIMENVGYARSGATEKEIQEACKAAVVHNDITNFPDGYYTKVGERGVKLSGGQSQRLAISQALLKNTQILMLDEATSAVDSGTEAQIQDAFKRSSLRKTSFVVAHRLSTIADADLILVLEQGKIVERGTHNELLAKEGRYAKLWTIQTSAHQTANEDNSS